MKKNIKIIVLFGPSFLYGSEKANVDVFVALSEFKNVKSLFLIDNKRGNNVISSYLKERDLNYRTVNYHFMFNKQMSLLQWFFKIYEIISGSFQLLRYIIKFKPTHIYTSKQEYFLNFLPILFFINTPIVYRIGDSPVTHNLPYKWLWKYMTKKVEKFICVSKFIENEVQQTLCNKQKSEVVYSRPHYKNYLPQNKKKNSNEFKILYVGQIGEHKGLRLLIDAAIVLCKNHIDISFDIAGKYDDKDPFYNELIEKVRVNRLLDKIRFIGYIMNVDELYEIANLHICPSIYNEPLANVLIDAKNHSIPSIIFKVGGLPEVIKHKHDGLICSNKNVFDLTDAIQFCYSNQDITKKMGLNAKKSLIELGIDSFSNIWFNVFNGTKR